MLCALWVLDRRQWRRGERRGVNRWWLGLGAALQAASSSWSVARQVVSGIVILVGTSYLVCSFVKVSIGCSILFSSEILARTDGDLTVSRRSNLLEQLGDAARQWLSSLLEACVLDDVVRLDRRQRRPSADRCWLVAPHQAALESCPGNVAGGCCGPDRHRCRTARRLVVQGGIGISIGRLMSVSRSPPSTASCYVAGASLPLRPNTAHGRGNPY